MESTTKNNSQRMNTRSRSKFKSKFQSVDIIRENQPEKFRQNNEPEIDDTEWEEGSFPSSSASRSYDNENNNDTDNWSNQTNDLTIEFDALPDSAKKKRIRRATTEDKEVAELVHRVHLLCLIARGRLINAACDDPLIQAALLSLLPPHLMKISEATKLTARDLTPLVSWFHQNFHVRSSMSGERPFHSALASALEMQGGSPEEVILRFSFVMSDDSLLTP